MLQNTNIRNLQTNIQKNQCCNGYFPKNSYKTHGLIAFPLCTLPFSSQCRSYFKGKGLLFSLPSHMPRGRRGYGQGPECGYWKEEQQKAKFLGQQLPLVYTKKKNKISLFVNILMKSGKKTTALRLLEKSLYIFMQSIIKIKMQPLSPLFTKKNHGRKIFVGNSHKSFSMGETHKNYNYKKQAQTNRPNLLFITRLYNKNYTSVYPLCFTNHNVFVDKHYKTRLLHENVKKNTPAACFSLASQGGKTLAVKNLFKEQFVIEYKNIALYPTHRPLCRKYVHTFLEKHCIWAGKIFPFIRNFLCIFEKFYRFKVFNVHQLKVYKKGGIYVQKPNSIKKKGCGINMYPWYKCNCNAFLYAANNASTTFIDRPTLPVYFEKGDIEHEKKLFLEQCNYKKKKHSCQRHAKGTEKANLFSFRQKNLWYNNIEKKSISWEKLSPAQSSCLLFSLYKAISNVKPPLECRSKRFGGSNRQIPATVSEHRQLAHAIGWIIQAAQAESCRQIKKKVYVSLQEPLAIALSSFSTKGQNLKNITKYMPPIGAVDKPFLPKDNFNTNNVSSTISLKSAPLRKITPVGSGTKSKTPSKKSMDFLEKHVQGAYHEKRPFLYKGAKFSRKSCKIPPYFSFFLADALKDAYYKRGTAIEKRNLWVDTALANRAYLRFRWW